MPVVFAAMDQTILVAAISSGVGVFTGLLVVAWHLGMMRGELHQLSQRMDRIETALAYRGLNFRNR